MAWYRLKELITWKPTIFSCDYGTCYVGNWPLMVGVPLSSIAQISSKRLKPPQNTVGFFWDWKQITQQNNNKIVLFVYIFTLCNSDFLNTHQQFPYENERVIVKVLSYIYLCPSLSYADLSYCTKNIATSRFSGMVGIDALMHWDSHHTKWWE